MSSIYKKNFIFDACRYEEWQSGSCISRGSIDTRIVAEVSGNTIHFELNDIAKLRMLTSFDFEMYGESSDVLSDRIQYTHPTMDMNPVVPIVCHLLFKGGTVNCVRFAMTNPDRLIEFYGSMVEVGQPASIKRPKRQSEESVSAEKILNELGGYGMVNTDAVMERAVKIFNENASVSSIIQAQNIIESLKLFVKAYQIDQEEHNGPGSIIKCKLLMFIALCNYKIDNINRAYCIAKQGIDAIDEAVEQSVFVGIPREMYGENTLNELIAQIENNRFDEVVDEEDYYEVDPEDIDTTKFDKIVGKMEAKGSINGGPFSKEYILAVIKKYDEIRMQLMIAVIQGNKQAMQVVMMLHEYACPIFYALEYWGYGHMRDFWKEDLPLAIYEKFKSKNILMEIQKSYNSTSFFFPFKAIDSDGSLKESTIAILRKLINELENE